MIVLSHGFDGDIRHECQHHTLPRAQIAERLGSPVYGQYDLSAVAVEPHPVGIGNASQNGPTDDLETWAILTVAVHSSDRLALEPVAQIGNANAFVQAVVECRPPSGSIARKIS